jgi:superfamily II DNA or RNA helicase
MATYLGRRGYSIFKECLSIEEQELIRNDLKVTPFVPKSSIVKPTSFSIYRESRKKFYVPRFYGINTYGKPNHIKINAGDPIHLSFIGKLRPYQIPAVQAYLKCAKKKGCGLLELFCGAGKTVCTLKIIAELQLKTLIIVHKTFLMNQWEERIQEFLPGARVGKIQGEIIDVENKDIVIGMLQSLSMKEYPLSLFQGFGFTIIDEVHHISAEVFSRALFKIVTPCMLGLSATMKRKDGLTKVFKMFLGEIVYTKKRDLCDNVLVKVIHYNHPEEIYYKEQYNFRGHVNYSAMIKQLCSFEPRSDFILKLLKDVLLENSEQQIMILGHNKNLLNYLYDNIEKQNICSVGYYIGGMKEKDLKISESKKVIIATYQMAAEGLDIKSLTSLFMVTPKTDVCQAVGRILRKKGGKHLIVDIVDIHGIFQRQWAKRRTYYKKQKYTIQEIELNNYSENKWITTYEKGVKKGKVKIKNKLLIEKCLID